MKAGKYTVRELFVNNFIEQIVIPEIQRDYVWGEEQVKGILDSIKEDFETFCKAKVIVQSDNPELTKLFEDFYKKQMFSSNIGFIYAYNDPEYTGKYFLIDGQQRITTIYLLLLALCIKTDKTVFQKYYHTNNVLKLDYRVRDTAHLFLKNFVNYFLIDENPSVEKVENQHWFFNANNLDPTINSIIANYKTILTYLDNNNLSQASFLDYIQHYIEFWYFDTNLSDQGEELYIYMNARGEQIQPNENLKADLIGNLKNEDLEEVENLAEFIEERNLNGLKNYWGKKWEEWQDFFWHNRGDNENADFGFNEFIDCIAGLEFYKIKLENELDGKEKANELLSLSLIERYIKALEFLENERENFKLGYDYAEWVNHYYNLIWSYLNKSIKRNANWFADFKDKNKNDDRNNMVLLWSFFYYYETNEENLNSDEFFRVMRFFYVRYNNYNRSVSTLIKTINLIIINGIIDSIDNELGVSDEKSEEETDTKLRTEEEKVKYTFLSGLIAEPQKLKEYESLIWKIEDHKYNLDGSYLKNKNISHLVDFLTNPSIDELKKICNRFYQLMSFEEGYEEKNLVTLLLHYGEFWRRVTPWYYYNFEFNNWRRIIRGADGNNNVFAEFFKEFLSYDSSRMLTELLEQKNKTFLEQNISNLYAITDFREQLLVYSMILDDIWSDGFHTCYENQEAEIQFFDKESNLFNCERYKGYHWYFWEEAKANHTDRAAMQNMLQDLINEQK